MASIHAWSSGSPRGWAQFPSSPLGSAHSLSSRLWLSPLHSYCCSWGSWHSPSKILGSAAVTRLCFHRQPFIGFLHGAKPQLLGITPSILGFQLPLRLHRCQWPLTVPSLSCSLWALQAFKTSTTGVTPTLPSQLPAQGTTWPPLEHSFCVLSGITSYIILPRWWMLVSS